MLLRLTNGTHTFTLSGDGALFSACTYMPRTPSLSEQQVRSALHSGGEITALARRNVTESARVVLEGHASALLDQVRKLEALFPVEEAQRRPAAGRVYVEFRMQATGDVYRSEVLAGRVEWPDAPIGPRLASQVAEIVLIWTRRYYWEQSALVDVPLTNGNGTHVTDGLTVYNHNDAHAGHDNFAHIDGNHVTGVLPAPAYLALGNSAGEPYWLRDVYVGHNVRSSPGAWQAILEAQDSSMPLGTNVPYAGASGGYLRSVSWTDAQTALNAYRWSLPASQLAHAGGNYFRVLMRVTGSPAGALFARVRIGYPSPTPIATLFESPEVQISDAPLQDLGVLFLPPVPLANPDSVTLTVVLRAASSGTLSVDFVHLTPLDSWRHVQQLGAQIGANSAVVDDGPEQMTYAQGESGAQVAYYSTFGQPIALWPGADQRLYFLWREITGMNIGRTFSVRVRYRPRRLTV